MALLGSQTMHRSSPGNHTCIGRTGAAPRGDANL
jgi:hypothetical protein